MFQHGFRSFRFYLTSLSAACLVFAAYCQTASADEVSIELAEDSATINIDGQLFTRYLVNSGNKPVLWPVVGPHGERVTRAYPVDQRGEHESDDHIHHRSIWFGYEGINGLNFWHEPKDFSQYGEHDGKQVHVEFVSAESDGHTATLVTRNQYQNGQGEVVAKDERTIVFGVYTLANGKARWIDYCIKLHSPQGPLNIGDTKEGAFAVRVAGTMKVDAELGGRIVSSNGDENDAAWGKEAAWVDYQGPTTPGGPTMGLAILAHPSSHSATPRWHVRPYGLFAANPFGASAYSNGEVAGGLEVPEGEPVVLRHRIVIHSGDHQQADLAAVYAKYKKSE